MSNTAAQAPAGSSNESPTTPAGENSPPGGGGENPSPPNSSTSAPPPESSSSSAPPPSPNSSQPPPQSPPNSNTTSPSPPLSPPPPASNSPPSGSQPPKSSPPSNSSSSSSSSPPPPLSTGPPVGSSPPPAPIQSSPPASRTPPAEGSTPPSPPESLPTPTPSTNTTLPAPGGSAPSPPAETISPPLAVSPPVAVSSPNTPTNPTPSTDSPPTSSASSPPPKTSYQVPSSSSSSSNSTNESSRSNGSSGTDYIVGATVAGAIIIALVALVFMVSRKRKRRAEVFAAQYRPPSEFSIKSDGYYYVQNTTGGSGQTDGFYNSQLHSPHGMGNNYGSQRGNMYHPGAIDSGGGIGGAKSLFSYEELMEITNGFSNQNILGQGGFGCVYKGWIPDGRVVAVKQLKAGSGQGEREFRAEVEIISRVHHRHLVSLVGYCIAEHHRLLIYEFVPNQTLEHHLHGNGMPVLDWVKRIKIALGAARGLAYLHEDCHPKIIHRDIKSANILLDDAFEAQVADFGLAKLTNDTSTHVSTRVMGTFGYMAPEYASSGKLTDRSDVFSFGVVLLELVTGRKPVDASQPLGDESLVEWARPLLNRALETGDLGELVDQRLENRYVESEMFRMIEAAAACVRHSAPKRPQMMRVARALDCEGEMSDLSNGVKFGQSTVFESGQYNQDIMKFRRVAFGSGESSEYDMYSGEYTSREVSHGPPSTWKSRDTSSDFTSGESETRAMNAHQ